MAEFEFVWNSVIPLSLQTWNFELQNVFFSKPWSPLIKLFLLQIWLSQCWIATFLSSSTHWFMTHLETNYINTSGKKQQQNKDDEDGGDNDAVGRQVYFNSIYCNFISSIFQQKISPWAVIKDGNKVWHLTSEVRSQYLEEANVLKIECNSIYKAITTIFC